MLGQPGGSAALSLSDVSLNGGAIIPSETVGSVTVEEFVNIRARFTSKVTLKPMKRLRLIWKEPVRVVQPQETMVNSYSGDFLFRLQVNLQQG